MCVRGVGQPGLERGGRSGVVALGRDGDQAAQQRWHVRPGTQRGRGESHGDDERLPGGESLVEQPQTVRCGHRGQAGAGEAVHVDVGELTGHAGALLPRAPRHRHGREPARDAVLGERVEEAVGGGVVPLPRTAEDTGGGGEQGEQGQVGGQLVQVECALDLRCQNGVEPFRGQRGDDTVVEHGGGVHDRCQRLLRGDRGEDGGEGVPVGDVTGGECDVGAHGGQLGDQFGGAGCRVAAAAGQQEVPVAVDPHEVAGDFGRRAFRWLR